MSKFTREDIMRLAQEEDVRYIRLQFTDLLGVIKNVEIPSSQLPKALDNKMMFDGSSIEGFVRIEESDMYLVPDLDTWVVFPWGNEHGKVARLICDIYNPDGTPFEGEGNTTFTISFFVLACILATLFYLATKKDEAEYD